MTPDDLAGSTEHSQQRALFAWSNCAALYGVAWADQPEAYDRRTREVLRVSHGTPYSIPALTRLFAIHNQGHGDAIRGGKAKAEGVKAGVPDMMLPCPLDGHAGLFIELKRKATKDTSADQDSWIDYLNRVGYKSVVAVGWKAARVELINYLWPLLPDIVGIQHK